jgi:hypothetical protein
MRRSECVVLSIEDEGKSVAALSNAGMFEFVGRTYFI